MGRLKHSWAMLKASAGILSRRRRLLVLPLLSGLCVLVLAASFLVPVVWGSGLLDRIDGVESGGEHLPYWYVLVFVFYLVQYTVVVFFNTALAGMVMRQLDGHAPTLRDGLRMAWAKWPHVLGYAAIAATVGWLLRALEQRLGLVGRWVTGLLGVTWSVATFLVVPVLAATDTGPIDAVKRSGRMLKRTWGENLIGHIGLGALFGVAIVVLFLVWIVPFVMAAGSGTPSIAWGLFGALMLMLLLAGLVKSALEGVYAVVLYRYAADGDVGADVDPVLMKQAFRAG